MEEEIARNLGKWQSENRAPQQGSQMPSGSTPINTTKIFGLNDAKRMSFDENMPQYGQPTQMSTSPFSSVLSGSPGRFTGFSRERRDSLKNMWHLDDFATQPDQ